MSAAFGRSLLPGFIAAMLMALGGPSMICAQTPPPTPSPTGLHAEVTYVCQVGAPNEIAVYDDPFSGFLGVDSQSSLEETFCFAPMSPGFLPGCAHKPAGRGAQPIVFDIDPSDTAKTYHFAEYGGQFFNCTFAVTIRDGVAAPTTITHTVVLSNYPFGDEIFASYHPVPRAEGIVAFNAGSPDDGKILISKAVWDAGYPSALQLSPDSVGNPRIKIAGTFRDAFTGQPRSGSVYLKINDPPDTAPYRGSDSRNGDNDGPLPLINGGTTANVQADSMGHFEAILTINSRVAGDNYQVVGSTNQNFNCGGTACPRSPVFTLWKRIYVEDEQMFRSGSFMNALANAGGRTIPIEDPAPFRNLAPGATLELIHADTGLGEGYYFDFVKFNALQQTPSGDWLVETHPTTPVPRDYGATPAGGGSSPALNAMRDAIGVVATSTYKTNPTLTAPLFATMFVDVRPAAAVVTEVPNVATLDDVTRIYLASRWLEQGAAVNQFVRRADPNVFHRIAATQTKLVPDPQTGCSGAELGVTSVSGGSNHSYVLVKRIEDLVAGVVPDRICGRRVGQEYFNAPAFIVNGEVTAHETAHWWVHSARVSSMDAQGHCIHTRYLDSKECLMHRPYAGPGLYDGEVLLHYEVNGADSEYMWVRRDPDPVPQP
jgi:hypothetical protein